MKITHIDITLGEDYKLSQRGHKLSIKSDSPDTTAAEKVKIDFDGNFFLELKKDDAGKTVVAISVGCIERVMDANTLEHLVTMAY